MSDVFYDASRWMHHSSYPTSGYSSLLFLWPLLMDKKGSKSLGECDEWEHGFRGQSSVKKCRDMIIAGKDKTIG